MGQVGRVEPEGRMEKNGLKVRFSSPTRPGSSAWRLLFDCDRDGRHEAGCHFGSGGERGGGGVTGHDRCRTAAAPPPIFASLSLPRALPWR